MWIKLTLLAILLSSCSGWVRYPHRNYQLVHTLDNEVACVQVPANPKYALFVDEVEFWNQGSCEMSRRADLMRIQAAEMQAGGHIQDSPQHSHDCKNSAYICN